MNKNEILEKSRKEHKNQDVYEKEVVKVTGFGAAIAAVAMCAVILCAEAVLTSEMNHGLGAIIYATAAGAFLTKGIKARRKAEFIMGIAFTVMAIVSLCFHIVALMSAAGIVVG